MPAEPHRYQTQLRMPDSRLPGGYYYWLNQFIYDGATQTNPYLARQRMVDFWIQCHCTFVQLCYQRTEYIVGSGDWTIDPAWWDDFGQYPVEGGYSPYNSVYLRHLVGGRQVSYSRLRMPVLAQDMVGTELHPDLISHIEGWANYALIEAAVCTAGGVLIEEFRCAPELSQWQYRQGSDRRKRVFIEYP